MNIEKYVRARSQDKCELCSSIDNLMVHNVAPATEPSEKDSVLLCSTCDEQINDTDKMDANHWRCLNESMWSEVPGVHILAWRTLTHLKGEGWPADLLDLMFLDEETMEWAQATGVGNESSGVKHVDSNGVILEAGDTVVLIKDLNVKGAGFVAKRGTAVRRITLVADNAEHIEGRVNDQRIVILTQYVKKSK